MKPIDIVIIVLAALAVVGVAVWQIIRKKQGKSCCGCDCGCGGCAPRKDSGEESGCNGRCSSCPSCPSLPKKTEQTNGSEK